MTIGAYLVIGPYFPLGWVATAVEAAILTLLGAELVLSYGSIGAFARDAVSSLRGGSIRAA